MQAHNKGRSFLLYKQTFLISESNAGWKMLSSEVYIS